MLQDSKLPRRRTFSQTRRRWRNLKGREGDYLKFTNRNLIAKAAAGIEDLAGLSAMVGVGCGLAGLAKTFNININRFIRFKPTDSRMRRMDFEFYVGKRRYFHESKGTTSRYQATRDQGEILKQKKSTSKYCVKNGPKMTASTGSISLYGRSNKGKAVTQITLVDPLIGRGSRTNRRTELSAVLNYYCNIYAATHTDNARRGQISLATWLWRLVQELDHGGLLPRKAPDHLRVNARVQESGRNGSTYAGTIFDERLTDKSLRMYRDFDHATASVPSPIRFVGVSAEVTKLIASCAWDRLRQYRDSNSSAKGIKKTAILPSGVMIRDLARDKLLEGYNRQAFESLRKKLL